jgi:hypothetical protein
MRLELETGLELFFQENWSKLNPKLSFILVLCLLCCSFTYDTQRTFIAFQFVHQMTKKQKSLNLVKEWGYIKKCSMMIGTFLLMSDFTIYQAYTSLNQSPSSCCFDFFWGTKKDRLHCSLPCWAMLWWCNWSLNECYGTSTLKKWPNPWQPMWGN